MTVFIENIYMSVSDHLTAVNVAAGADAPLLIVNLNIGLVEEYVSGS